MSFDLKNDLVRNKDNIFLRRNREVKNVIHGDVCCPSPVADPGFLKKYSGRQSLKVKGASACLHKPRRCFMKTSNNRKNRQR